MQLLQMREPTALTQLELSLLITQLGAFPNECFLCQIDCFFEDPGWWKLITQLLQRHNTIVSSMLAAQAKLPRFMRIAKNYITGKRQCDPFEKALALGEMSAVKDISIRMGELLDQQGHANNAVSNPCELPCAVWALQINLNRLIISLDPLAKRATTLEAETQEIAKKIIEWWSTFSGTGREQGDPLQIFAVSTAQIAIRTRFEWQCAVQGRLGHVNMERGVINCRVFEHFSTLVRLKEITRKVRFT
jgi:hypothetical protein